MSHRNVRKVLLDGLNLIFRPIGLELVPKWRYERYRLNDEIGSAPNSFSFWSRSYQYFLHRYNCGAYPALATERIIELALADYWLASVYPDNVQELGAVTPYYWPGRVKSIVDPVDESRFVTDRRSLLDVDLSGASTLSISTFEHVGTSDYGLEADAKLVSRALIKLIQESPRFLLTVPLGYNPVLDDALFGLSLPSDISLGFLVRTADRLGWREESDPALAKLPYGREGFCALSVAIMERGGVLAGQGTSRQSSAEVRLGAHGFALKS